MLDFYDFVENNSTLRQFSIDEFLFTAYDCPIEESPLDYWVKKNYFCYIVSGGVQWKTPIREYLFKEGEAVFIKKGVHRVSKALDDKLCALLIFMPDEFISSVVKNDISVAERPAQAQHTEPIIPVALDQSLTDYFASVLHYFTYPSSPPSRSLLKVKFKELIINIVTGCKNPKVTECFTQMCYNRKTALEPVMEENFFFNLKLEDFARLSGRSLATFNRDFVQAYNIPPGLWLKRKRLEYARYLLETTNFNVNQITTEVGFENTSHFIKIFKERYHVSPLKFRKALAVN